ncbi:zonular occludens toxin domain-containing protein [Duganella sp. HH101]|uniref:zonular occludens toxin domain-containing protein n=1 Tax=Duganella sp. HH101 TaxID=1781066 RepID=UPI0008940F98|nr:zonular occludens toxin domain-containing protein [Duganella sp. HH101]OFA02620.1 zonular occludens toxin (Zot) [Duganella sp. HH101]
MIDLNTGVPGSGKTLSMVEKLAALVDRWAAHPEEARPIFVSGVPDLALPHAIMPLKSVQVAKAGAPMLVPDWDEMPDGSLVIIDEAQGCFPPRSSASIAPAHVAWLNTHRHRGFDIWITTQHPKLIDGSVRALVGKHQHYRRLFGGQRAMVYEWDACSDSLAGMATAVTRYWSYPKKAFKWYKSAEIHTKQKFALPKWLLAFPIGIALAVVAVPRAYTTLSQGMAGKGLGASQKGGGGSVPPAATPVQLPAAQQVAGYYVQGPYCFSITKGGVIASEPPQCRENMK